MKKKSPSKLTLSKETLRKLALAESLVQGGTDNPAQQIETVWNSCPSICHCT